MAVLPHNPACPFEKLESPIVETALPNEACMVQHGSQKDRATEEWIDFPKPIPQDNLHVERSNHRPKPAPYAELG